MFGMMVVLVAAGVLLAGLVGMTLLWTVAVKIKHPNWSWKKCARYTTLIS